jgi:hypothetical protein
VYPVTVENPGYIFVRKRVLQPWKKTTSLCTKEEGIIVVQAIIDYLFEEALGFRVSSEY